MGKAHITKPHKKSATPLQRSRLPKLRLEQQSSTSVQRLSVTDCCEEAAENRTANSPCILAAPSGAQKAATGRDSLDSRNDVGPHAFSAQLLQVWAYGIPAKVHQGGKCHECACRQNLSCRYLLPRATSQIPESRVRAQPTFHGALLAVLRWSWTWTHQGSRALTWTTAKKMTKHPSPARPVTV